MVIRAHISPDYFLDSMGWEEVGLLLDELETSNRDSWEQCRLTMWATLQSQSNKKIKVTDVLPFAWDNAKQDTPEVTLSDIESFKQRNNLK